MPKAQKDILKNSHKVAGLVVGFITVVIVLILVVYFGGKTRNITVSNSNPQAATTSQDLSASEKATYVDTMQSYIASQPSTSTSKKASLVEEMNSKI
jgi:hypothetical protein